MDRNATIEGWDAFKNGTGRGSNPYEVVTAHHREWQEGFDQAGVRSAPAELHRCSSKTIDDEVA